MISFNNIIAITEHTVPILLSFYIGSWSDRFGRKPFLALCMAGKTLGAVGNLFAGIYLDQMDRWVWLAVYLPVQNISGGFLTFIMMTYSFIADNSTARYFKGRNSKGWVGTAKDGTLRDGLVLLRKEH